jgi:hypothetical protein
VFCTNTMQFLLLCLYNSLKSVLYRITAGRTLPWVTPFYKIGVCSNLNADVEEEWLCKQILINYKHTYKILHPWIYQIKSGTHGHMGVSKPYQKNHTNELLNTPDQEMLHPHHLDFIKVGPPNTGVQQHPINYHRTIQFHASLEPQNW